MLNGAIPGGAFGNYFEAKLEENFIVSCGRRSPANSWRASKSLASKESGISLVFPARRPNRLWQFLLSLGAEAKERSLL